MPTEVTLACGRAPAGAVFVSQNSATTRMRTFHENQPSRDRRETVDFTTRVEILPAVGALAHARVTTVAKDGHSSLREMAFPELDESIETLVTATGEVRRAGAYPASSAFFIPSLPLPSAAVKVGDTWALDHDWVSGVDRFPLRLEIIGILKAITACHDAHVCADVEISGHVALRVPPDNAAARFDSRIRGRALFDLDRGDVVWTHVVSREEIGLGPELSLVDSCLVSGPAGAKFACEPDFATDIVVPR